MSNLLLGNEAGSGTYNLSGSGLLSASQEAIGYFMGTGSFTQSDGTNSVYELDVGAGDGSSGTYNLSGNGLLSASAVECVGLSGTGSFTQSGGTNSLSTGGTLYLGYGAGSSGTYYLGGIGLLTTPYGASASSGQAASHNRAGPIWCPTNFIWETAATELTI